MISRDAAALEVTLVAPDGSAVGTMGKREAHEAPGHLHAAYSVLLLDGDDRLLLQQRADTKYHFAGLWTNACCSHPTGGEDLLVQARRRLVEEVGIDAELDVVGSFTYRAEDVLTGLVEHEHDTVLVGRVPSGTPAAPDPTEVQATRWVGVEELRADVAARPSAYTPWLLPALECAGL